MSACRHLLPNGGNVPDQAALQQDLTALRGFAQCMRSHGVPNWPDPTTGPDGNPDFNLVGIRGIPDQIRRSSRTPSTMRAPGAHALGGIRVHRP